MKVVKVEYWRATVVLSPVELGLLAGLCEEGARRPGPGEGWEEELRVAHCETLGAALRGLAVGATALGRLDGEGRRVLEGVVEEVGIVG